MYEDSGGAGRKGRIRFRGERIAEVRRVIYRPMLFRERQQLAESGNSWLVRWWLVGGGGLWSY